MSDREGPPLAGEKGDGRGSAPPGEAPWVGRVIAGKYRVERVIGQGGMGLVLAARHDKLGEPVAIKVLLPIMLEMDGMVSRFLREARAAARIKSHHVARVMDIDTLPSGVPYIVMEYLDGEDLQAEMTRRKSGFPIEEAVRYVIEACDAIAEAHDLGIVHRDLKPANLFVTRRRDGSTLLKVLDFGLSKLDAPGDLDATRPGQIMGSPKYMAPEQMLSPHDVDGRADIWALGAILYALLAGRAPFVAKTLPQVCSLVLRAQVIPPTTLRPAVPKELEDVVLRCLQREPEDRFSNVEELMIALAPFGPPPTTQRRSMLSIPVMDDVPSVRAPVLTGAPQSDSSSGGAAGPVTVISTSVLAEHRAIARRRGARKASVGAALMSIAALSVGLGAFVLVSRRVPPPAAPIVASAEVSEVRTAGVAPPPSASAEVPLVVPATPAPIEEGPPAIRATAAPVGKPPSTVIRSAAAGKPPAQSTKTSTNKRDPFGGLRK